MSDEELAELETQLIAKLKQQARLAEEATAIADRISAERDRRRAPATVHDLRSATRRAAAGPSADPSPDHPQ
jgi:hypothetical protein